MSNRIVENSDLNPFEEDIETIKIPVEIMGHWVITAIWARVFFWHEVSLS
jgi:hypothetical protein